MVDDDIEAYYGLDAEAERLFTDGRKRLELVRTLEILDRVLPSPPAHVLDVGGGTGVYAMELCERGYSVELVDPIEGHVERASAASAALGHDDRFTATVGDARSLPVDRTEHDAVLLLGPLYHLTDRADRLAAWREAIRVTRPGAVVVAAGISRFASLVDGLKRRTLGDADFRAMVERDLRDGQHRNPSVADRPDLFTTAYFHHPDELAAEAAEAGLRDVTLLGVEGLGWIVEEIDDIEEQAAAARAIESEPTLLGASAHLLAVGATPT